MSYQSIFDRFDLTDYGFLPSSPIPRFCNEEIRSDHPTHVCGANCQWEKVMNDLHLHNSDEDTRQVIMDLPDFDLKAITEDALLKRSYVILTLFANSYVWCGKPFAQTLPSKLAVPLHEVSKQLGIAPILTHASVDLYNWELEDPDLPFSLDNLKSQDLLTGTPDEQWFYLIMVAIEQVGGNVIKRMLDIQQMMEGPKETRFLPGMFSSVWTSAIGNSVKWVFDYSKMEQALNDIDIDLKKMCAIIKRMKEKCQPDVFWNVLRPYLAGWENNEHLPHGLIYEGVSDTPFEYCGGSAAQSSLFASIDAAFGVEHADDYFEKIKMYMPAKHRDFILYVKDSIQIKEYVESEGDNTLKEAFDKVISTIKEFRQLHHGLVIRYILRMVRKETNAATDGTESTDKSEADDDSNSSTRGDDNSSDKGTGGTDLRTFLKTSIKETEDAKVISK
jgi:indoleamine 2,3-dioxygenase